MVYRRVVISQDIFECMEDELSKCEMIELLAHEEHSKIAKAAAERRISYRKEKEQKERESAF